jgi:hypothetical protein
MANRGPTPDAGQDFSGEATNPGYAGLSPVELGGLGVPGYEAYSGTGGQPSLWDKLLDVAGNLGKMPGTAPGTTIGAPAGSPKPDQPPPLRLPGQMPTPPGMGAYFQALQNPPQGGGLMAQYMALQRLMKGG